MLASVCVSVSEYMQAELLYVYTYTLVRVRTNAARPSFFQVHVSLQGTKWWELSDSSVVFVQPLTQGRRRRTSGDKWEVVSQSVFISLDAVRLSHYSSTWHFLSSPFCTRVFVSVTVTQQEWASFQVRLNLPTNSNLSISWHLRWSRSVKNKVENIPGSAPFIGIGSRFLNLLSWHTPHSSNRFCGYLSSRFSLIRLNNRQTNAGENNLLSKGKNNNMYKVNTCS